MEAGVVAVWKPDRSEQATAPGKQGDPYEQALEDGASLATGMADARLDSPQPLRPREARAKRRQILDEQAARSEASAKPKKRLTTEQWKAWQKSKLAERTPEQRLAMRETAAFAKLSPAQQQLIDEAVDELVYGDQSTYESELLADYEDEDESPPWLPQDREPTEAEQAGLRHLDQHTRAQ